MGWLRQPGCASGEQFGDLGVVEPAERSAMVAPFQHGDLERVCGQWDGRRPLGSYYNGQTCGGRTVALANDGTINCP